MMMMLYTPHNLKEQSQTDFNRSYECLLERYLKVILLEILFLGLIQEFDHLRGEMSTPSFT